MVQRADCKCQNPTQCPVLQDLDLESRAVKSYPPPKMQEVYLLVGRQWPFTGDGDTYSNVYSFRKEKLLQGDCVEQERVVGTGATVRV